MCIGLCCVCGLVVLELGTVFWVVFCVFICCSGVRYCVLSGNFCVDCLYWRKVLFVVWCCLCGWVVLD